MKAINQNNSLLPAVLLAALLGSYLYTNSAEAADGALSNVSKVNSSIHVDANSQMGNVTTVNGSIDIGVGASANKVKAVNGSIEINDDATINSAETVNGRIRVNQRVNVQSYLTTVNGRIVLAGESRVNDKVTSVNGRIQLINASIGANIETRNGDITLQDGSVVEGDIIVKSERHRWLGGLFNFGRNVSEIEIDASSSVLGDIHLYREVNLSIDDDAQIGEIIKHF